MTGTPETIRAARKRLGWSQQQLAERIGVGLRQINRWESGDQEPSLGTARKLSEVLGVALTNAREDVLLVVANQETRAQLAARGLVTDGDAGCYTRASLASEVLSVGGVSLVRVEATDEETRSRVESLGR